MTVFCSFRSVPVIAPRLPPEADKESAERLLHKSAIQRSGARDLWPLLVANHTFSGIKAKSSGQRRRQRLLAKWECAIKCFWKWLLSSRFYCITLLQTLFSKVCFRWRHEILGESRNSRHVVLAETLFFISLAKHTQISNTDVDSSTRWANRFW